MNDLRTETAGAAIAGTVQYRCEACHELVDATEAVFAFPGKPADPNELSPFHPDHVPDKET